MSCGLLRIDSSDPDIIHTPYFSWRLVYTEYTRIAISVAGAGPVNSAAAGPDHSGGRAAQIIPSTIVPASRIV